MKHADLFLPIDVLTHAMSNKSTDFLLPVGILMDVQSMIVNQEMNYL